MSDPTTPLRLLARLEGTWHSVAADDAGTGRDTPASVYQNRFILGGHFLVLDFTQGTGSDPDYQMHGLIGWDAAASHYLFHWYDSLGGYGTAITGKLDGDLLILDGPDPVSGGHTRFSWALADDSHLLTIASSEDGKAWSTAMQAKYRRAG